MKENFSKLPSWLHSNKFFRSRLNSDYKVYIKNREKRIPSSECHPYDANLISSEQHDGTHVLMIDIDKDHFYSKSSTQGHAHITFRHKLKFESVVEILEVLKKHGIVENGFVEATKDRGYAALRMPGLVKNETNDRWFWDALPESNNNKETLW